MKSLSSLVSQATGKRSLRTLLIVPFVIQIFAAVGLTGYLSFYNGQKAINDLATQLSSSITDRIEQHLQNYLNTPHLIQQVQAAAVRNGTLNINDFSKLERQFWSEIQLYEAVDYVYYSDKEGNFIGVQKYQDGQIVVKLRDSLTAPKRMIYALDSQGNRTKLIKSQEYDPRTRPWYKATVAANSPTWSPIYISADLGMLQITPATPIYDEKGNFMGVLASNLILPKISNFLRQLRISKSGQAFIIERSGKLVASSTEEPPFIITGKDQVRLNASNSREPLIKYTTQHLLERFGNLKQLNVPLNLNFTLNGKKQLVQVSSLQNSRGLDWLIVVVIPEDDFMEQINANTRNTIVLCIGALGLAIILGIFTSRWISRPILKLSKASAAIADGELNQNVEEEGVKELKILAKSFNSMAHQLQESFETLEAKNVDLQQAKEELAQAKEQLEAVLDAVPGSISWVGADGLYLGVNRHLSEKLNLPPDAFIGQEVGFFNNSSQFAEFMRQFLASQETAASQMIEVGVNDALRYYLVAAQKYQQGSATVSVGIDVTERKKAEEALRLAEANYRSLFENALDGIFQSTPEGNFIRVNPAMARLCGYESPAEMMAMVNNIGSQLYVDPSRREEFKRQIEKEGEVKDFEYKVYRRDGSIIWVCQSTRAVRDANGKLLYYEGIVEDITQRKQKEEALERQVQQLRIEIDKTKQAQKVAEIVESDSFQKLKHKLTRMKQAREQKQKKF